MRHSICDRVASSFLTACVRFVPLPGRSHGRAGQCGHQQRRGVPRKAAAAGRPVDRVRQRSRAALTALCTLALLNCGRTPAEPKRQEGPRLLEQLPDPERTYSSSLMIMALPRPTRRNTP